MAKTDITFRGPAPQPSIGRLVCMAVLYVAVLAVLAYVLLKGKR